MSKAPVPFASEAAPAPRVQTGFGLGAILPLFWETAQSWLAHRAPKMGAALAYYTAFSLAPLLVLILTLASLAVRKDFARNAIIHQVDDLVGSKGGDAIREILAHTHSPASFSIQTALSLVIVLVGASGVFGELQDSLNQIWEVPSQSRSYWSLFRDRALAFAMVFVLGFLLLCSLVLSALLTGFSRLVAHAVPMVGLEITNGLMSLLVITALFAVIFRLLPDVKLTWRDVLPGALVASLLFGLGKFLLGWYLGRSSFSSSYGAAGSLMILLAWVFYTSQILFFGAEFARAFTLRFGSQRDRAPQPK